MIRDKRLEAFDNLVEKKYNIFNGIFLNLPFESIAKTGMYIPLLYKDCHEGLEAGESPLNIINEFFQQNADLESEEAQIAFLFNVIQYVERQVVLFDSIEEAAFEEINELGSNVTIKELSKIHRADLDFEALKSKLSDFSVRLVFTAHPTQFYPIEVLGIIEKLRKYISENNLEKIDVSLQQLGLTSFMKKVKPTPFEEANNIIYFLRNVYYNAIGDFYAKLKSEVVHDENFDNSNLMKIGFWPGGDRDGNPFVTAQTTMNVADNLRMTLMKCYYNDLKVLEQKLTFSNTADQIKILKGELYESMFNKQKIVPYQFIEEVLSSIKEMLVSQYKNLYLDDLNNFIDKTKIFKTHFATLDIRQNHEVHLDAVQAILVKNNIVKESIDELSKVELINILMTTNPTVNPSEYNDDLIKDTLLNIQQLPSIQAQNGEEGCNRYIISNSEDIFSVLYVYGLMRWCIDEEQMNFDIVPLFETMIGMQNSNEIMEELFNLKPYRDHIHRRHNKQTMMLGFSDGTKDGGYLRANWEIYKTKETLSSVCANHDIKAIFFDGRGGPPARGGGKTHRFYAAQGQNIANNEIQLTIQGQTISSTFGTIEQFTFNCEQMLTAGVTNHFKDNKSSLIHAENRALIEQLSDLSFKKYDKLKKHEMFIPYLEIMSTLKYYSSTNIGSRPGKRGSAKQLTLDDLRAISFVGSWSQLKQNVPGYFGIGTALQSLKNEGRMDEMKKLFNEVPFFKALMLNSMMSLSKSYFPLTAYMKDNSDFKEFWQILYDEYEMTKQMLLEVSGYERLMQEEPISSKSIKIREKIVLPLLTIQQYALQKIAAGDPQSEIYKKIVVRSLYGNINASRNSA